MNRFKHMALPLMLLMLAACGSQTSWQGKPGGSKEPIAGRVDTEKLVEKAKNVVTGKKKDAPADAATDGTDGSEAAESAEPVTEPLPEGASLSTEPAVAPAPGALSSTAAATGSSLLLNTQLQILRRAAIEGKPWALVSLEETTGGGFAARIQPVRGTSAQSVPFTPVVDELRAELEKAYPRLKGQKGLLHVDLVDETGKTVGRHRGAGWEF